MPVLGPNRILVLTNVLDTLGPQEFVRQIMEFLSGVHAQTGPQISWSIIEADDGTIRSVPSGGTTIDDLPSANLWHSSHDGSNLPTGSWCVIESADAESPGDEHFQMLLHVVNSTTLQGYLFPLADHATSPGPSASGLPTLPTHYDTGPSWAFTASSSYSMIVGADEGKAFFIRTNRISDMGWWYVGEVTPMSVTVGGRDLERRYVIRTVEDASPAVLSGENTEWGIWDNEQQRFFTASGYEIREYAHSPADLSQGDQITRGHTVNGALWFSLYGLCCFQDGAEGAFGYLRDVYVCNGASQGQYGQTFDRKIIWQYDNAQLVIANPVAAFGWDGETDYPIDLPAA